MLFNSFEFLFVFFPLSIVAYYVCARFGRTYGIAALVAASALFYAWWDYRFIVLLAGSIAFNHLAAHAIGRSAAQGRDRSASLLLAAALTGNLAILGLFKYGRFFLDNVNLVVGGSFGFTGLVLPLGISFFTFEQIAYLVDVRRNSTIITDPLRYAFFVSFFPRLVAGPILRYREILPQIADSRPDTVSAENIGVGLTIFIIGLAKKTILADGIAVFASPVFAAAGRGESLDLLFSWGGVLAYTLQLYFDFSGYSDMAIGAARCFGIRFPENFDSPYKSRSIVEFWRRWHITLSRFLRDYLYFSLGGNRRGPTRRYLNLMITMLLGGLWHGANWTFVFWGGLHGFYLVVNHGWLEIRRRVPLLERCAGTRASAFAAWLVTFLALAVAWVFFRAPTFHAAYSLLQDMAGQHGLVIPKGLAFLLGADAAALQRFGIAFADESGTTLIETYLWVSGLLAVALFLPNTQELLSRWNPVLEAIRPRASSLLLWQPSARWAVAIGLLGVLAVMSITRVSEFLYWQF
jgi:alginate O-acetyltransferase complex protein AlgI